MQQAILAPADRQRIAAAIRQAEQRTSGEVFCVLARTSDAYLLPASFMLALGLLAASLVFALALEGWWIEVALSSFVLVQLAVLAGALAVLWLVPSLRIHLVPRALAYRYAHANAARQFLAHNVHVTSARTGVLVFVSLAERYAEIVADAGIAARVPQQTWNDLVAGLIGHARGDRLADGFVETIAAVGALLAKEFPVRTEDANELDDHLVEI